MKLCEKVKDVLDVSVPNWMERLCEVNFDIQKLDKEYQIIIEGDGKRCFIGELHGGRDYQNDKGEHCTICTDLASLIPYVFNTDHGWYERDNLKYQIIRTGLLKIKKTIKSRVQLLEYIAKHIKKDHQKLMNKIQVSNDC